MDKPLLPTRRRVLRTTLASAAAAFSIPAPVLRGAPGSSGSAGSPGKKLRHAAIGAGGMAAIDLERIASHPEVEIVAVADVDATRSARILELFPEARIYQDWRELLATEGDWLDACNISIPDHMHAPVALEAMRRGLHVYGQKPLAHDVRETRLLAETARREGIVTQMGTQLASYTTDLSTIAWIRGGIIGPVRAVHLFSHKTWGDPEPVPDRSDPVPEGLDWDGWNGVAGPVRYVAGAYHPIQWRKRQAFGTGTLGDMGCHLFSSVCRALELGAPRTIRSEGPAPAHQNWAVDGLIRYRFAGGEFTVEDEIEVTWYDGARRPPDEFRALLGEAFPLEGAVWVGRDGVLIQPLGGWVRLFRHGRMVPQEVHGFRDVKGDVLDHWYEFIEAARGSGLIPKSSFETAGPLTETVLLGNVAAFFPGETLAWDEAAMRFPGKPEAEHHLRRTYRAGWGVA